VREYRSGFHGADRLRPADNPRSGAAGQLAGATVAAKGLQRFHKNVRTREIAVHTGENKKRGEMSYSRQNPNLFGGDLRGRHARRHRSRRSPAAIKKLLSRLEMAVSGEIEKIYFYILRRGRGWQGIRRGPEAGCVGNFTGQFLPRQKSVVVGAIRKNFPNAGVCPR